jgi:hypothetical protein
MCTVITCGGTLKDRVQGNSLYSLQELKDNTAFECKLLLFQNMNCGMCQETFLCYKGLLRAGGYYFSSLV